MWVRSSVNMWGIFSLVIFFYFHVDNVMWVGLGSAARTSLYGHVDSVR